MILSQLYLNCTLHDAIAETLTTTEAQEVMNMMDEVEQNARLIFLFVSSWPSFLL
jgi:hypothetical protein